MANPLRHPSEGWGLKVEPRARRKRSQPALGGRPTPSPQRRLGPQPRAARMPQTVPACAGRTTHSPSPQRRLGPQPRATRVPQTVPACAGRTTHSVTPAKAWGLKLEPHACRKRSQPCAGMTPTPPSPQRRLGPRPRATRAPQTVPSLRWHDHPPHPRPVLRRQHRPFTHPRASSTACAAIEGARG